MVNSDSEDDTTNVIITPNMRDYFDCDISLAELAWLEKKHITNTFMSLTELTEEIKGYNNSTEIVPANDLVNAVLLLKKLNTKVKDMKIQNTDLEQRLKKYTNGENHKRYYEKNKEKIKETGASYLEKLRIENPEKIKEYSHRAYLNQKKKKLEKEAELLKEMANRVL
jgi:hypothetical protein